MWHNHQFRQRNKTSKIAVEVNVGGDGQEWLDKILKSSGRQCTGAFHIIESVKNPLPTMSHKALFCKKGVLIA